MAYEDRYKETMANLLRVQAEKLAKTVVNTPLPVAEVIALVTLIDTYLQAGHEHDSDDFTNLLKAAHVHLSVSLNIQK